MPNTRKNNKKSAQPKQDQAKEMEELRAANKKLSAQLTSALLQNNTKKRKTGMGRELEDAVREAINQKVWRMMNFVRNPNEENTLAAMAIQATELPSYKGKDDQIKANVEAFVGQYSHRVLQLLNDKRSTVTSALKKACHTYWTKHGEKMPNRKELARVVIRHADADHDLFQWWWDEVLTAVAGKNVHWNDRIKYYVTISEHKEIVPQPNSEEGTVEMPYITPLLEAYALLVIENNYHKWPFLYGKTKTIDPKHQIVVRKTRKPGQKDEANKHYLYMDEVEGKLDTIHSNPNIGQAKYGGWKPASLKKYQNWVKFCTKGRNSDHGKALEAAILAELRTANSIEGTTYDETKRNNLLKTGVDEGEDEDDLGPLIYLPGDDVADDGEEYEEEASDNDAGS